MSKLQLPELGENIDAVDVSAVLVAVGDLVRRDQPVIEVETEKASLEVPATTDGRVTELLVKTGDKVKVGQVILVVDSEGQEAPAPPTADAAPSVAESAAAPEPEPEPEPVPLATPPAAPHAAAREQPGIGATAPAAPSVRALARELGVNILEVPGSGRGGRISRDDVKAWAKRLIQGFALSQGARSAPALPDFSKWGEIERTPIGNVRRATATNMANAWATVPHVTQFDHADITRLEAMRKDFNRRPEAEGRKLTVTAVVLKMAAAALKQFPQFNSSLDLAAEQVIHKRFIHLGVAVDTDRGLLVPVVRDVDKKPLLAVAAEINDLAERARNKKVKPDELTGSTFTVSNLGGLGTTYFSPIVNWPEVAILGVGRAEVRAEYENGQFEPRLILPLSASYDHRLIDGADAARFLRWIAGALEQPLLLLLDDA